jgi:copper homeostasis protein
MRDFFFTFVFMKPTLEVIATQLRHVEMALRSGAHRIELCSALSSDGLTPSYGFIQSAIAQSVLPVMVMIRPREGDFRYSIEEIACMQQDIAWAKECGAAGIVIGILDEHENVPVHILKTWVQAAYPMEVTFHRAFDVCSDPFQALEDIIAAGCTRILTSGQEKQCTDGKALILQLQEKAGDRIVIMAGSGIHSNTLSLILDPNIREYHMSGHQAGTPENVQEKMFGAQPSLNVTEIQQVARMLSEYEVNEWS